MRMVISADDDINRGHLGVGGDEEGVTSDLTSVVTHGLHVHGERFTPPRSPRDFRFHAAVAVPYVHPHHRLPGIKGRLQPGDCERAPQLPRTGMGARS